MKVGMNSFGTLAPMKRMLTAMLTLLSAGFMLTSCNNSTEENPGAVDTLARHTAADWGEVDGKKVQLFTLTNKNGMQVSISNYGGTITKWLAPDKNGVQANIVLGFDSLSGYLAKPPYFGSTIGRYGNRIAKAKFALDGKTYTLAANNGANNLHGGNKGFDKVVWDALPAGDSLTLSYVSKGGEEGFPGDLKVTVTFTLNDDNELKIEYTAETDQPTPVNLTNHSYFNLSGDATKDILGHTLWIDAERYTPVDTSLIPTGELASVKGTAFDFTSPHKIGERIGQVAGGYDHNFVLNRNGNDLHLVAWLQDSASGRKLEVYTTEPGLQFYSGNFLDGSIKNSKGQPIQKHAALCLETQHFPDSPNQPSFPSTILKPGEKYHTVTMYKIISEK
jgi:aldose 1-epimerase